MDRRSFLRALAGGTAAAVAVRSWPFRTFFIPQKPALANRFFEGQVFVTNGSVYMPGQYIAVYDSSGGLDRGVFRIVSVDEPRGEMQMEYLSSFRTPYPGRLGYFQRPKNIELVTRLTKEIELQERTLLWKPNESQWAAWRRKLQLA